MRRQIGSTTSTEPHFDSQVLKFVSRAEHLAWRERWRKGRWVKLSWTPEERAAILRQDEDYRQADARWQVNHGAVAGGASILQWRDGNDW
jgi:hypothetical protein